MNNDILFLVKFTKAEYINSIIEGNLRFTPSQVYVNLEQEQHDKGQGDLLEGKMKIPFLDAKAYDNNTGELVGVWKDSTATVAIQDVNNIPIHCMSYGTKENCSEYESSLRYTIKFDKEKEKTIRNDFKDANSALIFLKPQQFIDDMMQDYDVVAEKIKYFDYDKLTIQYMLHLSGLESFNSGTQYSMYYDNRYRHLMCKDIAFQQQNEFRFIMRADKISDAKSYPIRKFEYLHVSIDEFFEGVQVDLCDI